jgi:hypothetical protein
MIPGMWFLILDLFEGGYCTMQQFSMDAQIMPDYKLVVHQDSLIYMSQLLDDHGWYNIFKTEMDNGRQPIVVKDYFESTKWHVGQSGVGGHLNLNP